MKVKAEISQDDASTNQGMPVSTSKIAEAGGEPETFSLSPQKEPASQHFDLRPLASRTGRQKHYCCLSHQVCGML